MEDQDRCTEVCVILVSGELDPHATVGKLRDEHGVLVPLVVITSPDEAEKWLRAGAVSFVPPGTDPALILRLLSGIACLRGMAADMNPLSGLPGNRLIDETLRRDVLGAGESVAYIDITGFKPFNDYYGFARGDAVLRMLSSLLTETMEHRFVGHVGGDDFVAVGSGSGFMESLACITATFSARVTGFYSAPDRSRGGIEALDRSGEFSFFPFMELTVSVVSGRDCDNLGILAARAGAEKKRIRGEPCLTTVSSVLAEAGQEPTMDDLTEWSGSRSTGLLFSKAMIESAGILGDSGMTACLIETLRDHPDRFIRKSAARALGMLQGAPAGEALLGAMEDPSRHVRATAAAAIPYVLGERAGPKLEKTLEDSCTWVRRAALRGLGISGYGRAFELLGGILRDGPPPSRSSLDRRKELEAALDGASILGDQRLADAMLPYLEGSDGVDRMRAWKAFVTLGGDTCLRRLLTAVENGEGHIIIPMLSRLRTEGLPIETLASLERLLLLEMESCGEHRREALELVSGLPYPVDTDERKRLVGLLLAGGDRRLAESVLRILVRRGDLPRGGEVPRLLRRIEGRRGEVLFTRSGLLDLLEWASRGGGEISRTFLEKLLRHDSREIRTAAARAVTSMASD